MKVVAYYMARRSFILALILPLLFSCKNNSREGNETDSTTAIPVSVTTVGLNEQQNVISLSAAAEAEHMVNIGFMAAGKISSVNFEEGQYIKKGQLIASIDPADYLLGVSAANADLNKANDEFRRLKLMYDRGSLTPSDYQTIVKTVEQAKAQQQLQLKRLNDTRLYAPISGLLAKRSAEPGMVVGQGTPVFTIVTLRPIRISASVPETELGQISIGSITEVYIAALDSTFTGTVSLIGAVADPTTRAYAVKISLDNRNQKIRPGMVAEVSLKGKQKNKVLTVPAEAVLHDAADAAFVFVVDVQKKYVYKRKVTVGNIFGNEIELSAGLKAGEVVVTGGKQKVLNGSKVQIIDKGQ